MRKTAKSYPVGFYVYRLCDPRNGLPFYVGKGLRDRAWQHERDVRAGSAKGNARKIRAISAILEAGLCVAVEIVAEYALESDALEHEFRLVDSMPALTNIMPGGIGRVETPAQFERRIRLRKRKLNMVRKREHEAACARRIERKRVEFHSVPGAQRHQAEIDAWLTDPKNRRGLMRPMRYA